MFSRMRGVGLESQLPSPLPEKRRREAEVYHGIWTVTKMGLEDAFKDGLNEVLRVELDQV